MFLNQKSREALMKALPAWTLGMAIATPVVAVLQGALLLYDYRVHHSQTPRPDMPARGVVILQQDEPDDDSITSAIGRRFRRRRQSLLSSHRPPLRLLVIGDSLAAGVGTSLSTIPALPQSIAQALSQRLGGLPVYWTCVGTPGLSATEVVQEIHQLHDVQLPTPIVRRLAEWHVAQRIAAQEKIDSVAHRTLSWWSKLGQPIQLDNESGNPKNEASDGNKVNTTSEDADEKDDSSDSRHGALWNRLRRARLGVQRDVRNFRRIFEPIDVRPDAESDEGNDIRDRTERRVHQMVRRNSLDPSFVNQYDVAVVLTGINDLKDSFLPFMMSAQRARALADARKDSEDEGLKGELLRIIQALKETVLSSSSSTTSSDEKSASPRASSQQHKGSEAKRRHKNDGRAVPSAQLVRRATLRRQGPLVVFPALPLEPIELNHRAPLSWFISPLVRRVDYNKEVLAEAFPELVLFVPSPRSAVFSDAEARRGPLWESFQREQVLLRLTDMVHTVNDKLGELLHSQHTPSPLWALKSTDAALTVLDDSETSLYELREDCVVMVRNTDSLSHRRPGASMVAPDGIHPNDQGYDLWGKFIATSIIDYWEREQSCVSSNG